MKNSDALLIGFDHTHGNIAILAEPDELLGEE